MRKIDLVEINTVSSSVLAFCTKIFCGVDQVTGQPSIMVIEIAVDGNKTLDGAISIPVYLNADNINSSAHIKALYYFRELGYPFVPIILENLEIKYTDKYFATASSFTTISIEEAKRDYLEPEDLL